LSKFPEAFPKGSERVRKGFSKGFRKGPERVGDGLNAAGRRSYCSDAKKVV
jgi:hypothetical protein